MIEYQKVSINTPLSHYHAITEGLDETVSELVIFDSFGKIQITSDQTDRSVLNKAIKQLKAKAINWSDATLEQQSSQISEDSRLYIKALTLDADEKLFWLGAIVNTSEQEVCKQQPNRLFRFLGDISPIIGQDYVNSNLITNMSDELASRYEELNLLYGLDTGFISMDGNSSTEVYESIMESCSEHLAVDFAGLILEDEDPIIDCNVKLENKKIKKLINKLKGPVLSNIASEHETLVVNKDEVMDWVLPELQLEYKYIATPIFKTADKMVGILVVANEDAKASFTNSDRKLCEVLAGEISKFIQSEHDQLTGLYNLKGIIKKLEQQIFDNNEIPKSSALLHIDIDQFKFVNELSGHQAGDTLLLQLAALIPKQIRKRDILARISGDEYAILLINCSLDKALSIAKKISTAIERFRFIYKDKIFDITVSIGVESFGDKKDTSDSVLSNAESACLTAKELGRNQIRIYQASDELMNKRKEDVLWVSRIHNALEDDRFKLYKQVISPIQLHNKNEVHYEILLRLLDEEGKIISPFGFIPAAERYEQMPKIDRWVITKTLDTLEAYDKKHKNKILSLSINLSGQSLCQEGFVDFVLNAIASKSINPSRLCFEITETAAIMNLPYALNFIKKVKAIGCKLSLDDFGSGMSSFGYLKNLPVDHLKIDGHFVKSMLNDPIDRAMVESIHHIGHVMGLKTIAEFVEDIEMVEQLRLMGVDYVQGYALGKPEPFTV